jgi:hypothetical protein
MRTTLIALLISSFVIPSRGAISSATQPINNKAAQTQKLSPAAANTRTQLQKVKVSGTFKDVRLGDILKQLATHVETKSDEPLMWTYATGFPFAKRVSFTSKDQTFEAALDRLLTQVGDGAGYVIVSSPGDKYDGWVRLTLNGERGMAQPTALHEEEATAAERLALAKKLINAGKLESAKPLLESLVRKFAATRAAIEAKMLLERFEK